jgi:hypothetical protein
MRCSPLSKAITTSSPRLGWNTLPWLLDAGVDWTSGSAIGLDPSSGFATAFSDSKIGGK